MNMRIELSLRTKGQLLLHGGLCNPAAPVRLIFHIMCLSCYLWGLAAWGGTPPCYFLLFRLFESVPLIMRVHLRQIDVLNTASSFPRRSFVIFVVKIGYCRSHFAWSVLRLTYQLRDKKGYDSRIGGPVPRNQKAMWKRVKFFQEVIHNLKGSVGSHLWIQITLHWLWGTTSCLIWIIWSCKR